MARKATRTKSHRVYAKGAVKGTSATLKRAVKRKSESAKIHERMEQIRDSLSAMEQRRLEEEEAAAEFERRLASDPTRLLALRGLRLVKPGKLEEIVENENNNNNNNDDNDEKERLREERRARAKLQLETQKAERNAKKQNETRRKGEKKFGLAAVNSKTLYLSKREELIAEGVPVARAEASAKLYADLKSDPKIRAFTEGAKGWGNIALQLEPVMKEKVVKKPVVIPAPVEKAAIAIRSKSYVSALASRKADYKQLALTNLPNKTDGKGFDIKAMKRQVYGKMSGKEIFPELTKATTPVEHVYISAKTDIRGVLRVAAFVTYKSHAYAKRALDYHRAHPIKFKYYEEGRVVEKAPMIDQANKEDEKAAFRA
uniref:Uncharacterized protein n=1 Tax=viral metagenome TaxID=1070528 RepID=A0A6C0K367_9ZZZZ